LQYTVVIELGEDGYWIAHVPALPGCHSQGKTREEALINIKEAIELYIETCIAYGDPIPQPAKEIEIHKVTIEIESS
jgi:predicted RNase H-like HicB family nuclease